MNLNVTILLIGIILLLSPLSVRADESEKILSTVSERYNESNQRLVTPSNEVTNDDDDNHDDLKDRLSKQMKMTLFWFQIVIESVSSFLKNVKEVIPIGVGLIALIIALIALIIAWQAKCITKRYEKKSAERVKRDKEIEEIHLSIYDKIIGSDDARYSVSDQSNYSSKSWKFIEPSKKNHYSSLKF